MYSGRGYYPLPVSTLTWVTKNTRRIRMFSIFSIAIVLLAIVIIGMALIFPLDKLAKRNIIGTNIQTGTYKFGVAGESLFRIYDKLSGEESIDQETHYITDNKSNQNRRHITWLEKRFGIVWVSIFWPVKKIYRFPISAEKLQRYDETGKELPLREQVREGTVREVDHLRRFVNHPIIVKDIELGADRWKTDALVMTLLEYVGPRKVVFDHNGKISPIVDAAVGAEVNDFCNEKSMDYKAFVEADKGATSEIAKRILALNGSLTPTTEPDGLIRTAGVRIVTAWIPEANLSPAQQALNDAATAVDRARQEADAKVEEARGIAAVEGAPLVGLANSLQQVYASFPQGTSDEQKTAVVTEKIHADGIAKLKNLTTLVERGGNATPIVSTNK